MGASHSQFGEIQYRDVIKYSSSRERLLSTTPVVLPIPRVILSSVEPGDEGHAAFLKFYYDKASVTEVFTLGSGDAGAFVGDVYSKFMRFTDVGKFVDGTVDVTYYTEFGFAQFAPELPTSGDKDWLILLKITLNFGSSEGHANSGILRFTKSTNTMKLIVFEPHANNTHVLGMVGIFKHHAEKHFPGARFVHEEFDSPHSVQTNSPICVQWSLLLALMYLLNCVMHQGAMCSVDQMHRLIPFIYERRTQIMPAWFYFMHLIHGDLSSSEQFFNPRRRSVNDRKRPRGYLDSSFGSENSAMDVEKCSGRSKEMCVYPCEMSNDECRNGLLFKRRRETEPVARFPDRNREEEDRREMALMNEFRKHGRIPRGWVDS